MRSPPPCRSCRVLVIDANGRTAAHTAEVLFACGHWARCATSAAAVMHAVRCHHFDVVLVNTTSFGGDLDLLLLQVCPLYPVAAVELSERPHWFEKPRVEHEGFEESIRNPVTPARLMRALWHVAGLHAGPPPLDDEHHSFRNRG